MSQLKQILLGIDLKRQGCFFVAFFASAIQIGPVNIFKGKHRKPWSSGTHRKTPFVVGVVSVVPVIVAVVEVEVPGRRRTLSPHFSRQAGPPGADP